jgi:hypothetical protein
LGWPVPGTSSTFASVRFLLAGWLASKVGTFVECWFLGHPGYSAGWLLHVANSWEVCCCCCCGSRLLLLRWRRSIASACGIHSSIGETLIRFVVFVHLSRVYTPASPIYPSRSPPRIMQPSSTFTFVSRRRRRGNSRYKKIRNRQKGRRTLASATLEFETQVAHRTQSSSAKRTDKTSFSDNCATFAKEKTTKTQNPKSEQHAFAVCVVWQRNTRRTSAL